MNGNSQLVSGDYHHSFFSSGRRRPSVLLDVFLPIKSPPSFSKDISYIILNKS